MTEAAQRLVKESQQAATRYWEYLAAMPAPAGGVHD